MSLPTYLPICLAADARPGTGRPLVSFTDAVSPITNISLKPWSERSGRTTTRPPRSCSAESHCAAGEAITPAAQITEPASIRPLARSTPRLEWAGFRTYDACHRIDAVCFRHKD